MSKPSATNSKKKPSLRFESVKIESLFEVLDAVAWLDSPGTKAIAQYANLDPRTAGKILKNARLIGLVQCPGDDAYLLAQPYPYKGSLDEKRKVVREALLKHPLIRSIRQFIGLGNNLEDAMRKASTVTGELNYEQGAIAPLVSWANSEKALDLGVRVETLVNEAVAAKEVRHIEHEQERIAFISHSARDKPFVRRLAADLVASGIKVWLDEQNMLVGDSIPEKIAQGLAESDFFLLVVSENSVKSEWVRRELNSAIVHEIERRKVKVLPIRIDAAQMPDTIKDKLYADFSRSYDEGLDNLVRSIKARKAVTDGGS
jgi:hypothetical protein